MRPAALAFGLNWSDRLLARRLLRRLLCLLAWCIGRNLHFAVGPAPALGRTWLLAVARLLLRFLGYIENTVAVPRGNIEDVAVRVIRDP
jgi:hypothetical protein